MHRVRRLIPAEIWIAALLIAASCVTSHQPETLVREGRVVHVESHINRGGEATILITIAYENGGLYEQDTREYPMGSREGILFGHTGRCVSVREIPGGEQTLQRCRD